MNAPSTKALNQSGFTLLEVLIAAAILSIGLLGVASLQLNSLRSNQIANLRTEALVAAEDMADRIFANKAGALAGNYHFSGSGTLNTAATIANCSTTTGCNASEMAQNDMQEWTTNLASILPSGTGTVCVDSNASTSCNNTLGSNSVTQVITITWTERGGTSGASSDQSTFTFSFQVNE